jgi:purine-binding chemotaxis protein CheW
MNLATADIEDTPNFGEGAQMPYLLGMAKVKGKVKILLDIGQVLSSHELKGLEQVLS